MLILQMHKLGKTYFQPNKMNNLQIILGKSYQNIYQHTICYPQKLCKT